MSQLDGPVALPVNPVMLPGRAESMRVLEARLSDITSAVRFGARSAAEMWQPTNFLPRFENLDAAIADIAEIQRQSRLLSSELLVVAIGDTVTEDGLPKFVPPLFAMQGLPTTASGDPYTQTGRLQAFFRRWSAEEHRHGQVLQNFLRFSGRVNMEEYERTVQLFLEDEMDLGTGNDPYKMFVYTSFQELATQYSHKNVARLAAESGSPMLAKISGMVAADEGRHAAAYSAFVEIFFQTDPNGMMIALRDMFRRGIVMPAHNMREVDASGSILQPGETYEFFSNVAQQLGVYTAKDYAAISGRLLQQWKVAQKTGDEWAALPFQGLNPEAVEAQQHIVRQQKLLEKIAQRDRTKPLPDRQTSWLVQAPRGK